MVKGYDFDKHLTLESQVARTAVLQAHGYALEYIDIKMNIEIQIYSCMGKNHIQQGTLPYIHVLATPVENLNWREERGNYRRISVL